MYKFLERVARALAAAGFEASSDGRILTVNGCKFLAEEGRREGGVVFLDARFNDGKRGYDIERAVGLVIRALPRKLAALKERDECLARAAFVRGLIGEAKPVSDERFKTWYFVASDVALTGSDGGCMEVKLATDDKDKLLRAVEALKQL